MMSDELQKKNGSSPSKCVCRGGYRRASGPGDVIPPANYLTRRPPPQGFPRAAGTFVVEVCTGVGTKMNRTTTENLYSEIEDRHQ